MRQVVSDLGPPKDCRRSLKPVELPNIFDVDVTAVKGVTAERQKPRTSGPGSRNQHKTNNVSKVQPLLNGKPAVNKDLSMASQQQSTSSWDPRGMALAPTMALSTKVQPSRPMFSASIKNSVDSSTEVNIPSPTVLNQQILPHMSIIAPSASRSQENNTGLGWNEEEEAAAALEI